MTESVQSTYEEARRCPKCQQPGEDRHQELAHDGKGSTIHHIYCVNNRCRWYNTPWLVQVNKDGSVPPPTDHKGQAKEYRPNSGDGELAAAIIASVERDQALSMQKDGHGEIRRR